METARDLEYDEYDPTTNAALRQKRRYDEYEWSDAVKSPWNLSRRTRIFNRLRLRPRDIAGVRIRWRHHLTECEGVGRRPVTTEMIEAFDRLRDRRRMAGRHPPERHECVGHPFEPFAPAPALTPDEPPMLAPAPAVTPSEPPALAPTPALVPLEPPTSAPAPAG